MTKISKIDLSQTKRIQFLSQLDLIVWWRLNHCVKTLVWKVKFLKK